MSKTAIRYLEVDPWVVVEKGFHQDRSKVSESIFSVANEFMGVRGYFEEGYSGEAQIGSYFNGIFERAKLEHPWPHNGLALDDHYMLNAVDWLYTRIKLDGEELDLAKCAFENFKRQLNLKNGLLTRSFDWKTKKGKKLRLRFERFTSMAKANLGCQRVTFEALNFNGAVNVEMGLDFSIQQYSQKKKIWNVPKKSSTLNNCSIVGEAPVSKHKVFSSFSLDSNEDIKTRKVDRDKYIGRAFSLTLKKAKPVSIQKKVANFAEKREKVSAAKFYDASLKKATSILKVDFDDALKLHAKYWGDVWDKLDIEIEGDRLNQQGVRFCIFQLHQTYHGVDPSNNVAAKGLTGEGYDGKAWWDTETYCLPFYMFNNPKAARNLLEYRYKTLPQACERSKEVDDCVGARYPMATIDGTETIFVWQHGDLEIHVSAAITYAIWHYEKIVGDKEFLYSIGAEILVEVSRYYASRGQFSQLNGDFGYWNVMGADEFHMQVHNNAYTNVMAKKTFDYSLEILEEMKKKAPKALAALKKKIALKPAELKDWKLKSGKMRTNFDEKTQLYEQHDGFFDLPHLDCSKLNPDELPLYDHWAYLRIFRYDMIKQPDALLLLFFYSHEYSDKCKKVNYEYYEPRCSHESSLSPAIHSILASEINMHKKAYSYFQHATRLDLDDYNRNTYDGLHTTSMSAAWMNIVQGFGGMRTDGECIEFKPSIPKKWKSYCFRIIYKGSVLKVTVNKKEAIFELIEGDTIQIHVFGKLKKVDSKGVSVKLPAAKIEK